jgi:hypothetical protein
VCRRPHAADDCRGALLLALLQLFEAHGLPAIPFKGPTLAASAYGDLAFRQFSDLDILVRTHDLRKATDLLTAQGYQLELTKAEEARFLREHFHYSFTRDAGRVRVEIHWALASPCWAFPIDFARLWERLEPVSLAGTTVGSFHPEDLLLILCVHGARHYWERLAWICDIAELIRVHREMDWDRLMEQAMRLRYARILFVGLFLASNLLGGAPPEAVLRRVRADSLVPSLAAPVRQWLFSDATELVWDVDYYIFYLRLREDWRDRARYVLPYLCDLLRKAITPNAKDRALLPLPTPLTFLYYVLRPLRLLREYGRRRSKRHHGC